LGADYCRGLDRNRFSGQLVQKPPFFLKSNSLMESAAVKRGSLEAKRHSRGGGEERMDLRTERVLPMVSIAKSA
jgi:hypothetical protein